MNPNETSESNVHYVVDAMRGEPEFNQARLDEIKERVRVGLPKYANEVEGEEDLVFG
jgi:hypothetical protein